MIKTKDGYGKLIGSSYNGDATLILLSNGGNIGYAIPSTGNTLVQRNTSGQIESSVDDTISPFKVSSVKVNENLNSDLLDGFHAAGLFQSLTSTKDKNLTIKIGNTELSINDLYATFDAAGNNIMNKYVTTDTAQSISGTKTFTTQLKFTYNGAPFTVSNATVVTNLNADFLDGTHKADLFTDFSNVTSGADVNKLSITIGGTTRKVLVNYAQNAGSIGGITLDNLFTALTSTPIKNLSATIGGITKDITDLYSNYWVFQDIGNKNFNNLYGDTYRGTSWYGGGSNAATNNPLGNGTAFGMQVWRNASDYTAQLIMSSDGRMYVRYYNGTTWSGLKTLAFTSDLSTGGSYWADLPVLAAADATTTPTFKIATATTQVTTPKVHSTGRLTLNATSTALDLKYADDSTKSVILNGSEFKPFDDADGNLDLGASDARWKGLYAGTGDFTGVVRTKGEGFYLASNGAAYSRSRWISTNDGIWLQSATSTGSGTKGTLWITGYNNTNLTALKIKADTTDFNGRIGIDSDGKIAAVNTSYRQAGMYGIYDSTKVGHIWSMGTSYTINANGSNTGNLYGLAYFHTNWSNDSTKNDGSKTEVSSYAGNHLAAWVVNGEVYASLGNYVWSRNGFKKHGIDDTYALTGGGGHKAIGNVQNTAFYKRETSVNGTVWGMAGTTNSAAFAIYAPTTAGTSGYLLKSNGTGEPEWIDPTSLSIGNADSVDGYHALKSFSSAAEIDNTAFFWKANGTISDVSSMSYAALLNVVGDPSRRWQIWNSRGDHLLYWRPEKADFSDYADVHILLDNYNSEGFIKEYSPQSKKWTANTTVSAWRRILTINGYGNILLSMCWSLNSQASLHLYLINTGWLTARIVQLGYNGYSSNCWVLIRVTYTASTTFHVEVYNSYGYNGATTLSVGCRATMLDNTCSITTITANTAGGGTSLSSLTSHYNIAKNFYAERATVADSLYTDSTSGSSHANALQTYFNNNKSTIPRNKTISFYSSAYSNGSLYMGYFRDGYDSNPYGGFFVAHYGTPYYVGITNGSYVQSTILTTGNYTSTLDGRYVKKSGDTMTGTLTMSTGASIQLWDDSATASHRLTLRNDSDIGRIYNYTGSAYGAMYLGHDGTNAIVITSGLNVGIGTGSPLSKLHVNGGLLNITYNSGTLTIGSLNPSYTHYSTTGGTHWFNKAVTINGNHYPHSDNSFSSGTNSKRWSNVYSTLGNFSSYVLATRFISTVATGTQPYACTSTTLNTNLNADLLDGYHVTSLFRNFGGKSVDFNFTDNNNNNGIYYLHSDYTLSNKNGITYGSLMNFSASASSWLLISSSSSILYYRQRWWSGGGGNWSSWKQIAFTSDIPNPANYYWANVKVSTSSSTSTKPTFNTCYTSNWFRSTGSTGWYNESYGGGIYMTDTTWVRVYNGKSFYVPGNAQIDGTLYLYKTTDTSATADNRPALIVGGGPTSAHIEMDSNEIIAKSNGTTITTLYLNSGGAANTVRITESTVGSTTKGVYLSAGAITAMTYSLGATVNSGTTNKLAYYSGTNAISAYNSTVGSTTKGVYLSAGTITAMTYSLNANVNSGITNKLAYYSGTNAISAYNNNVGDHYTPVYISNGVPTSCYAKYIGSVTWGRSCSGFILVYQFGPITTLLGYISKIRLLNTSSTNYVFKLPNTARIPSTSCGFSIVQRGDYNKDRNTVIRLSGQYGYCDPNYCEYDPNYNSYYFTVAYM